MQNPYRIGRRPGQQGPRWVFRQLGTQRKNGLQDPGSSAEQPGQRTAELLEKQPYRKKWTTSENKDIMRCFYAAEPSKHGFQKRMYELWLAKYPDTMVDEQRLANQRRVIINPNLLTQMELEELQRNIAKQLAQPVEASNQNDETTPVAAHQQPNIIEVPMEQNHALNPKQLELKDKLQKQLQETNRIRLPTLKDAPKKELAQAVRDINDVLTTIQTASIGETNQLLYSAAVVITEELGYDIRPTSRKPNQSPKWKTRLEHQISNWRNDISCLEHLKKAGTLRNAKTKQWLIKKYRLETKTIAEVIEELKQRVLATAKKIERYEARIKQYRQNRQFNTNQRRFYQSLDDDNNTTEVPDTEETTKFWQNIWDNPKDHNTNAAWITSTESEQGECLMDDLTITADMIKKQAKNVKNWTVPGKDEVHGYWLKHLTSLHTRMAWQLNQLLQTGTIEDWMTTGKTTLLIKNKKKGAVPNNYRQITCLPTTFKLMTAIITEAIQNHLEQNGLILEEQKENRRKSRGTKDQLLIDKMILRNAKRRKTNLMSLGLITKRPSTRYRTAGSQRASRCLESIVTLDSS